MIKMVDYEDVARELINMKNRTPNTDKRCISRVDKKNCRGVIKMVKEKKYKKLDFPDLVEIQKAIDSLNGSLVRTSEGNDYCPKNYVKVSESGDFAPRGWVKYPDEKFRPK